MDISTLCARRERHINLDNGIDREKYFYSRYNHPQKEDLENTLQNLYESKGKCICLNSGMACINFAIMLFKPKIIIIDKNVTHEVHDLVAEFYGDRMHILDFSKTFTLPTTTENTLAIFDVVSNPLCRSYDVKKICNELKKHNFISLVDNTMLTAYYNNPFNDGANIVIESLGKYACGHGDAMGGAILFGENPPELYITGLSGYAISPFSAFEIRKGLATLPLRMKHIANSTLNVTNYLKEKGIKILGSDARCGMITFSLGNNENYIDSFLNGLKIIKNLFVFGQDNTVICKMVAREYDEFPYLRMLRLCIGLESSEDLISDIDQALRR